MPNPKGPPTARAHRQVQRQGVDADADREGEDDAQEQEAAENVALDSRFALGRNCALHPATRGQETEFGTGILTLVPRQALDSE